MVEKLQHQKPVLDVDKWLPESPTDSRWKDVIKICDICIFPMSSTMNYWRQSNDFINANKKCVWFETLTRDFLTVSVVRIPYGHSWRDPSNFRSRSNVRSSAHWLSGGNITTPDLQLRYPWFLHHHLWFQLCWVLIFLLYGYNWIEEILGFPASCLWRWIWVTSIALFVFYGVTIAFRK